MERTEWGDGEYKNFWQTGPGTLAGRFMRMFWQPIFRSEDLPPKGSKPLHILGEDLTLYRGEGGEPHLVDFRCAHRRAQLSVGWVEEDCIRCFYHGWKYDASGQCVEQPAEEKPFSDKVRILSYPVQDYLGLIFAYMGNSAQPPLPRYPDFEHVDGVRYARIEYRNFNFFQDFENGMDRAHTGFAHRARAGAFDGAIDSPAVGAEEDDWGLKTYTKHASGRKGIQSYGMPNIQHILSTFADADSLIWKVPVDDGHTAHFMVRAFRGLEAVRKYAEDRAQRVTKTWYDPMALAQEIVAGKLKYEQIDPYTTDMVSLEDDIALLAQGAIVDRSKEWLGSSDAPIRLLRLIWERELRSIAQGKMPKCWNYLPGTSALRRA